jgi:hypothetical protein
MKIRSNQNILSAAVLATLTMVPAAPDVMAQAGGLMLEEVVVSARKRAEDLQDVGISTAHLHATSVTWRLFPQT